MSEEMPKTVKIDGVDYAYEDLSQNALYAVSQLGSLKDLIEESKRETDRLQMSSNAFSAYLKDEIAGLTVEVPADGEEKE